MIRTFLHILLSCDLKTKQNRKQGKYYLHYTTKCKMLQYFRYCETTANYDHKMLLS